LDTRLAASEAADQPRDRTVRQELARLACVVSGVAQ